MKDEDIHEYSLEKLIIIQIGNNIGSDTTRKYYPKNLVQKIIKNTQPAALLTEGPELYNHILDLHALASTASRLYSADLVKRFFTNVLHSLIHGIFVDDSDVCSLEICYNHLILWQILEAISKSSEGVKFTARGICLEAISQELKLMNNDISQFYNADEIAILETTGPFQKYNAPKETQGYIKPGYGPVVMLHVIGRKYQYGSFDIFKQIGVFFVLATPTKLRIWRMHMPSKKMFGWYANTRSELISIFRKTSPVNLL
ncbi:hypothetical protein BCV72DRAFT_238323 [Rhizopus microsporus var. microsporus]|uniref:Uncharacterized protein n=1 Tax=Rhizopus microsporus var. microsporus TaxID=86635 RepID=A0A1X0RG36_RHIZD|nr:hypothetical protein BCV72DRAFT_238323 [Rhizopus microsporus var. microsporus]